MLLTLISEKFELVPSIRDKLSQAVLNFNGEVSIRLSTSFLVDLVLVLFGFRHAVPVTRTCFIALANNPRKGIGYSSENQLSEYWGQ